MVQDAQLAVLSQRRTLKRRSLAAWLASLALFIVASESAHAMALRPRELTPSFSVPYELGPDPLKIQFRILEYRQYNIDLLLKYRMDTQRDLAKSLAGGPESHGSADHGVPTEFLISLTRLPGGEEVAKIRFESIGIRRSAGRDSDGMGVLARRIGEVRLRPGRYVMEVVSARDSTPFAQLKTEIGLFYDRKHTPIDE